MRWDRVRSKWMLEMVSLKSFGRSNRMNTVFSSLSHYSALPGLTQSRSQVIKSGLINCTGDLLLLQTSKLKVSSKKLILKPKVLSHWEVRLSAVILQSEKNPVLKLDA